jgi:hypothetical protein
MPKEVDLRKWFYDLKTLVADLESIPGADTEKDRRRRAVIEVLKEVENKEDFFIKCPPMVMSVYIVPGQYDDDKR